MGLGGPEGVRQRGVFARINLWPIGRAPPHTIAALWDLHDLQLADTNHPFMLHLWPPACSSSPHALPSKQVPFEAQEKALFEMVGGKGPTGAGLGQSNCGTTMGQSVAVLWVGFLYLRSLST